MGNTESAVDSGDLFGDTSLESKDEPERAVSGLQFSAFLDADALKEALSNYPNADLSPIAIKEEKIKKWLTSVNQRGPDALVTLDEFVDSVSEFDVRREDCELFFQQLDRYSEDSLSGVVLMSALAEKAANRGLVGLMPCRLEPNMCDAYVDEKTTPVRGCAGRELLLFLKRNRCPSDQLTVPALSVHQALMQLRDIYIRACFAAENEEGETNSGDNEEDEEKGHKVNVAKCFSQVTVSSNIGSQHALTDNSEQSYWQSNGSPRTHWVRVHMLPGIKVSEVLLSVNTTDESYMPANIVISVGNSPHYMKEIKTVNIPKEFTGKYSLIKNISTPYKFIQVNVKRCHRDGCDCRIRGIHVKGVRYVKEPQPTVLDSVMIWNLNLMTATAQAAMPLAPLLRNTLLNQTRSTICSLQPFALSPSSKDRPAFLDNFVMEELTKFVHRLCRKEEDPVGTVEVDPAELATLLQYMLIAGNTNGILDVLQQVLENMHLPFPCKALLKQLDDVATEMRVKHSVSLRMQVVQCDGGQKDEEYKVDNCISLPEKTSKGSSPASAKPYVTEEGKKVVNMVLEHHQQRMLEVQSLSIMGQKGDQAPAMGLVFYLRRKEAVTSDFFEHFSKYDTMSKTELAALVSERKQGETYNEDVPVAFFGSTQDEERVPLTCTTDACRCIYLKFIGTVGDKAERMGIQKITINGKAVRKEESLLGVNQVIGSSAPLPSDSEVSGSILLTRIVGFLIQMLVDLRTIAQRLQVQEQDLSSLTEGHLSVEEISLEKIWSLYVPLAISPDPSGKLLAHLCLMLLRAALPFLEESAGRKRNSGSTRGEVSQTILSHLCSLIDSAEEDAKTHELAKDIVVSGVPVFFPSVQSRQEHLMEMFASVGRVQSASWMLKFKGLCQYFVVKDSFKLLQLPSSPKAKDDIDVEKVMDTLLRIVNVACNQTRMTLKGEVGMEAEMIVQLLQSIQCSFFQWCSRHIEGKQKDLREAAGILIIRYSFLLLEKAVDLLGQLASLQLNEATMEKLPCTVIGCVLPQLLFYLNSIPFPGSFVALKLLPPLKELLMAVANTEKQHPNLFVFTVPKPDSSTEEGDAVKEEEAKDTHVLKMWVRESSSGAVHEVHKEESFLAPGATRMTVDFDPSCRVERQYDKLEFTSSDSSSTHSLHGTVGSSDWPTHIEFQGNKLTFRFNVISSTGSWMYKYIVRAYGLQPQSMGPLADLQLTIAHMIGKFCSFVMGSRRQKYLKEEEKDPVEDEGKKLGQKAESWLTSSDAWKKLFRGGMTEKFSRTLSTRHSSIPAGSEFNEMLTSLASGHGGQEIIETCRAMHRGPQMHYGGAVVDQALHAVFAALVWHSQQIREELVAAGTSLKVTQGMKDAYAMAQFLRRELVEARQKVAAARESEEDPVKQSKMDEDGPVKDCLNKALFLLRFAGLATSKKLLPVIPQQTTSFLMKYRQWQRSASAASVDKDDAGAPEVAVETEQSLAQKYPSFCIVMDFVRKTSVTKEMVEEFLTQRQKAAKDLAVVLNFVSDHLRNADIFSLPSVAFLSQLFSQQHHFPEHYVHELEGCGLELEGRVRQSYYDIITQLLELLRSHGSVGQAHEEVTWEKMVVKGYLLHLFDTHWRDYDMQFIGDQHLPEFLLSTAIQTRFDGARSVLPKQPHEDEMLARYERFQTYLTVLKSVTSLGQLQELMRESAVTVDEKECHLFIVSSLWHNSNLSVSVQCDGCRTDISSAWYRDLEASDLDLCQTCYFHRPDRRPQLYHRDHKFLEMRFCCDICHLMITSHRLHCETKDDYDLCLGCYRKEERSGSLSPNDKWTFYPLTLHKPEEEKTNSYYTTKREISKGVSLSAAEKDPKNATLKAYLAQHSFLLFTHICLSTASVLNQADSGIEDSYLHTVAVIYLDCLKLLTFCLRSGLAMSREKDMQKETDASSAARGGTPERQNSKPPLLRVTSITDHPEVFDEIGEMEKEFCYSMFDRLMGLLALMLPKEKDLPKWVTQNPNVGQLLSERLLPTLIDISRCSNPELAVQGLSVLSQFLLRISPDVADRAVYAAGQEGSTSTRKEGERSTDVSGLAAVKYLCSTGAHHLEKSDFTSASVVARVIILLANCASWKPAVAMQLKQCLDMKLQEMNMSAVFSLYTLAGFPSLPCIGSVVRFGEKESERRAVITEIKETTQAALITLDKRETMLSPLTDVTLEDPPQGCVESSHMQGLVHLLKKILEIERMSQDQMTAQIYFILGLVVKAIRVALTVVEAGQLNCLISDAHLMAELTRLAQKPTGRDKKWLLPHLEMYLVNSYRHKSSDKEEGTEAQQKEKKSKEGEEEEEKKEGMSTDPKDGLKGPAADMFDTMVDAFDCTRAVLRAAYDISEGDVERWLMMLQDSFVDNVFKPSDAVLEKAKEWEPQPVEAIAEKIQATGDDSGLVSFTPRKIDIKNVTAVKETGPLKIKITVEKKEGDGTADKDKDKKMAKESLEMLFRELKALEVGQTDSTQVYQTAEAVAVLQARQLILSTLTHWPWGAQKVVSLPLVFGSQDIMKTFGMIDLISNMEPADDVNKITQNIMEYGDPQEVSKLVLVAAECMGELIVGTQMRESPHPLGVKAGKVEEVSVTIPNASSVTVTFDSSCTFKGTFTLNSTMGSNKVELKGTQLAGKIHILPGDAVKMAISCDDEDTESWGWKVNVVGSQTGRFETGFLILRKWLSNARSKEWGIPLADLWQHLVIVACQNTGRRRLQMIGLILEILVLYKDNLLSSRSGSSSSSSTSSTLKKIDFGLLRPLWKLYYSLLEDLDKRKKKEFVPEVVQALSELFLVVESFSKDLGMAEQLMSELWVDEKLMAVFAQGVRNVAFLSIGVDVTNKASTTFLEAKPQLDNLASLRYQELEEDEEGESRSGNTSTDDDDSFDSDDTSDEEDDTCDDSDISDES